jgi:hypothetical protein
MQMITKGWIMSGHEKYFWVTKNSKKIVFDMMIPTTNGMIFAMYFTRDTKMSEVSVSEVSVSH